MANKNKVASGRNPSEARIRDAVKKAINETSVATALGLSEESVLRLGGGMRVQHGTLLVAERNLPHLSTENAR